MQRVAQPVIRFGGNSLFLWVIEVLDKQNYHLIAAVCDYTVDFLSYIKMRWMIRNIWKWVKYFFTALYV